VERSWDRYNYNSRQTGFPDQVSAPPDPFTDEEHWLDVFLRRALMAGAAAVLWMAIVAVSVLTVSVLLDGWPQ
jgi:hypothetical protein